MVFLALVHSFILTYIFDIVKHVKTQHEKHEENSDVCHGQQRLCLLQEHLEEATTGVDDPGSYGVASPVIVEDAVVGRPGVPMQLLLSLPHPLTHLVAVQGTALVDLILHVPHILVHSVALSMGIFVIGFEVSSLFAAER